MLMQLIKTKNKMNKNLKKIKIINSLNKVKKSKLFNKLIMNKLKIRIWKIEQKKIKH